MTAVVVIAKAPVPGRVKTRLCPPLTETEAAALAQAALQDTLAAVSAARVGRRVVCLDGDPVGWLPAGFDVLPQRGSGLAERLANLFADVGGPAIVIGMDTPQVTPAQLTAAAAALTTHDAALGPAFDGGYWSIGLRAPDPRVFHRIPMSTQHTGSYQRARLATLGLRCADLPPLRDVDTIADADVIATTYPNTRFAAALEAIGIQRGQVSAANL